MKSTVLQVLGMSCKHCVNAVVGALEAEEGVLGASVDLEKKAVSVKHDETRVTIEGISALIEEQGFEVAAVIACEDD